jgi:3D (Asp-Asp-Asp) domain-containing protein
MTKRNIQTTDLPSSVVSVISEHVNAKAQGAIGDGSTDDTTALGNALSVAKSAGVPLFIPAGNYKITSQLDWTGSDIVVIGAGSGLTTIRQFTDNTGVVHVGNGSQCEFSGMRLAWNNKQTASNTGATGILVGGNPGLSLSYSRFSDIRIERCAYGLQYAQALNSSYGGAFSCLFENLIIVGYAITALNLDSSTGIGMTGNVFNNTYTNNNWTGSGNDAATGPAVNINGASEIVFNQLNVEECSLTGADAITIGTGPNNVVINSLHCEQLDLEADGHGMIYASAGALLTINGLTNEGNNWTAGTSKPFFRVNYDGKVIVNGMSSAFSSYTVSVTAHPLVTFAGSASDCDVWLRGLDAGVFSEHTYPYVTAAVNGCRVWELNGPQTPINAQTSTTYTLARTDSGCSIRTNNASTNTVTVPADTTVIPIGTEVEVSQYGTGQTTIVAAGGVTIRAQGGALKIASQYGSATLRKIAANEWTAVGALST